MTSANVKKKKHPFFKHDEIYKYYYVLIITYLFSEIRTVRGYAFLIKTSSTSECGGDEKGVAGKRSFKYRPPVIQGRED